MTSTENAEHKKGVDLFKSPKISPLLESKRMFSYSSVWDYQNIRLNHTVKQTSQ